jgi:hypothetical protein
MSLSPPTLDLDGLVPHPLVRGPLRAALHGTSGVLGVLVAQPVGEDGVEEDRTPDLRWDPQGVLAGEGVADVVLRGAWVEEIPLGIGCGLGEQGRDVGSEDGREWEGGVSPFAVAEVPEDGAQAVLVACMRALHLQRGLVVD